MTSQPAVIKPARPAGQGPIFLVALGHGATHWVAATVDVLPCINRDLGLGDAQAGLPASIFRAASVGANFGSGPLYVATVALLGFVLFAVRPVVHSWMMDLTPREMGGSATSLMFGTQAALAAITPLAGGMVADIWGLPSVFYPAFPQ